MTSKYFLIEYSDLSFEKQQEMETSVAEQILEDLKNEAEHGRYGVNFGRKEYKGMTWQEAIVREYSIDYTLWETDEEAKKFDWNFAVEQYIQTEAIEKCQNAMIYHHKMEVEI